MFIQNLVYWVTLWAIYFIRVSWKWVNLKRNENFEHFSNIEKNFIFYKVSLFYFNYNVFSSFFSLESNRFFFAKKISFENQFAIINKFTSSELFIRCNDNTWQKLDSFQAKRCFHSSRRRSSNWNQNINCRLLIMLTNRACSSNWGLNGLHKKCHAIRFFVKFCHSVISQSSGAIYVQQSFKQL